MSNTDSTSKLNARSLFSGLVPLFMLAHFSHHLLTALTVPLLPMIRSDFSLDYTQSGLVASAFTVLYGLGQVPAGWLADRIGQRALITLGICGVAFAGLMIGLSQTYIMMIIFLGLMGLLGGGYHPASPPVIAASVAPGNVGRALGLHTIGGGASFFLAPLVAAGVAAAWGWRGPYLVLAVPTVIFGIIFYVRMGRLAQAQKTGQATAISEGQPSSARHISRLAAVIVLSTFTQAVLFSIISFIPLYFVDHFGISQETAAAMISIIYSAGLWVGPIAGHVSDRVGRMPMLLTVCFAAGPVIYLLNVVPSGIGVVALLISIGVIIYVRMPVSESYLVDQVPRRNRSTVLGVYYFGAMEGGGVLTPVVGYW